MPTRSALGDGGRDRCWAVRCTVKASSTLRPVLATRRDHRPGLDGIRDLRTVQGRRPAPQLRWPAGYHPLLAVAAGTGDVLMARLRKGRTNTARGAANFLRETISRVRYAGAAGQLTMRADSGFYNQDIVTACWKMDVRFSITIRQHQTFCNLIQAIPEVHWTPVPYWMEGASDMAATSYNPFASGPDAVPVRLIVRRVKPTLGSQLALFPDYSYHALSMTGWK